MKKLLVVILGCAMLMSSSTAIALGQNANDWDQRIAWPGPQANQDSYWEAWINALPGWNNASCNKYGESHSGWLPGKYEFGIIKAGQWNYVYIQPDSKGRYLEGDRQDLSHIFKCHADREIIPPPPPPPPPPPSGPGDANAKWIGPGADPFYRFIFLNPSSESNARATCLVKFEGRNGPRVIRKRLADGEGYRTGWTWVKGSTQVKVRCYEGGDLTFRKNFRAARPGMYGELWFGFTKGPFNL